MNAEDGWLNLDNMSLTELPPLPDDLEGLYCQNNNLTELSGLPNNLFYLDCKNNQLTTLPDPLPTELQYLFCDNNKLRVIPRLPENFMDLSISNNPLIKAFREIVEIYENSNKNINDIKTLIASVNDYYEEKEKLYNRFANTTTQASHLSKFQTLLRDPVTGANWYYGPPKKILPPGIINGPNSIISSFLSGNPRGSVKQQANFLKLKGELLKKDLNRTGGTRRHKRKNKRTKKVNRK